MIFKLVSVAAIVLISSNAAFATGAACSKATPDKFKPQAELVAALKAKGVTVSKVKTENGCYEVYGKDAAGKKVNAAFNAETLAAVDNPEAGEN
jgi:hypothetical protein